MDVKQVNQKLTQIFKEEKKRIVFWYDGEKEFEESLSSIHVEDVTLLRLDEVGALDLKIRIEAQGNNSKYLLYAPYYEPEPEKDWLFDIKLYSYTFHADKASILMGELGLENQSLRPFIKERKAFFKNQDRLDRLKKWIAPDDREDDIDLKMITVLARAEQPDPFAILMKLLEPLSKSGSFIPDEASKPWNDIETLGLAPSFWKFMAKTFGCVIESSQALSDLLIKIFVTDFANQYKKELPVSLEHFRLTGSAKIMNASVFISQWQTHTIHCKNFNRVSKFFARKLNMDQILATLQIEDLVDVMTFENVERRIISSFRDQIINDAEKEFSVIQDAVKKRLDGYWPNATFDSDIKDNLYKTAYQALTTSINLFELRKKYDGGFSFKSAEDMFNAYTGELFCFDQYYRHFNELADKTEQAGWDILKQLRLSVEDCYSNWFMDKLSLCWGEFLESDHGLLQHWHLPNICNQYNFFKYKIKSDYVKSDRKRIFVIISDALRYEAGKEIADRINGKYRLKAQIEPMLGILPGYTALGMACLLPYNTLSFKEGAAIPLIDDKPCGSFEQRAAILEGVEGTAVKASDLSAMSKDKGREFVKPHKVIYIYHDQIDAVGDKAVSEDKAFEAVRTAIDELTALVGFIINSLNGTHVMITADHGFIYQDKKPDNLDKSILEMEPEGLVKKHKRFLMGKDLGASDKVFSGNTRQTAHTDTDMAFWLPKGTNRFNFVGGAKFFHGGAMLQEIVIPLVTVSEMKGIHKEKSQISKVGVSMLGSMKKIVTNIPRFEFIQTDAVSNRMKPRTLKISLRDGNELISSEETITFDSSSSSMDDRRKAVKLGLKSGPFDNKKEYALVLRNAEDETEYERLPLMIDIAFANDF